MKKVTHALAVVAVFAGAGALLYRFGLSEEAKQGVKAAARSVRDATEDISERISELCGTEVGEDMTARQREVSLQWERLGF